MAEEGIKGLAHIGIITANVDVSRKFYESLGFKLLEDLIQPNGKPVIFMGAENAVLEIYETEPVNRSGTIDHVALEVADIEVIWKKMQALGYEALEGKIQDLDFGVRKIRYFTISGPGKEKIEFSENA